MKTAVILPLLGKGHRLYEQIDGLRRQEEAEKFRLVLASASPDLAVHQQIQAARPHGHIDDIRRVEQPAGIAVLPDLLNLAVEHVADCDVAIVLPEDVVPRGDFLKCIGGFDIMRAAPAAVCPICIQPKDPFPAWRPFLPGALNLLHYGLFVGWVTAFRTEAVKAVRGDTNRWFAPEFLHDPAWDLLLTVAGQSEVLFCPTKTDCPTWGAGDQPKNRIQDRIRTLLRLDYDPFYACFALAEPLLERNLRWRSSPNLMPVAEMAKAILEVIKDRTWEKAKP